VGRFDLALALAVVCNGCSDTRRRQLLNEL
jgi:hypothetical protein